MSPWSSGDSLSPSILNLRQGAATLPTGFSTNSLQAESGSSVNIFSDVSTGLLAASKAIQVGGLPSSTSGLLSLRANSLQSDYIFLQDAAGLKSNFLLGLRTGDGSTADGLNLYDMSHTTLLVRFSSDSIKFFKPVVGPVFDSGGALASTYNAAIYGVGLSKESQIQAAITAAAIDGVKRVYLPASLYPYNANVISFDSRVQMVREGGNWAFYDVLAYGARGDGTGNDRVACQAALTAVSAISGGGTVFFPAGTYPVDSVLTGTDYYSLYIGSNTRMQLDPNALVSYTSNNTRATIIFTTSSGATTSLVTGNVPARTSTITLTSASGFAIGQDIELFDTNNFEINKIVGLAGTVVTLETPTLWSYTTAAGVAAQIFAFTEHATITGGTIDGKNNSGNGIEVFHCRNMVVDGVRVQNTAGDGRGVLFAGLTHRSKIINCSVRSINDAGIEVYTTTCHNLVANNDVTATRINGITVHGDFNSCTNNDIRGSALSANSYAGIHVDTAKACQLVGNRIIGSNGYGMNIAGSTISALAIVNNEIITTNNDGIFVNVAQDLELVGNQILQANGIGIYLSSVTRATITGNRSSRNSGDGFRLSTGDDILVTGNDCTFNGAFGVNFTTIPVRATVTGNNLSNNGSGPVSGSGPIYSNNVGY